VPPAPLPPPLISIAVCDLKLEARVQVNVSIRLRSWGVEGLRAAVKAFYYLKLEVLHEAL